MIYGYARVSTVGQARDGNSLEKQQEQLKAAGAEKIYLDAYTGTKKHRPEFDKLMIDELEKEYLYNGARNKKLSNKPVPTAFRIEKLNQTKRNQSNDYMKDFYSSMRRDNYG